MRWVQLQETDANNVFVSFCQMPFLLTPETKTCILQGEANLQKHHMVRMFNHLYDTSEFLDLRVSLISTTLTPPVTPLSPAGVAGVLCRLRKMMACVLRVTAYFSNRKCIGRFSLVVAE